MSLLPIMAKLSERLLMSRIKEAVPLNRLIPPYQFGFRENHSTAQQCHRIINKIRETLEAKKCALQFFLTYNELSTRSGTKVCYTS
jgi:hypothetical protein